VNNAGINRPAAGLEVSESEWIDHFNTNLNRIVEAEAIASTVALASPVFPSVRQMGYASAPVQFTRDADETNRLNYEEFLWIDDAYRQRLFAGLQGRCWYLDHDLPRSLHAESPTGAM
jgi:NAD(P)-dependent dehydrogenase (short-subunit alcohol dehydrogenase family)